MSTEIASQSPVGPQSERKRGLLGRLFLGALPAVYFLAIFLVMVGSFGLHMRKSGIFACPADQYGGDHYLGHCEATAYGDYDHGAIWWGLEPKVRDAAGKADVLFLGSSRTTFGFSAPSLGHWFAGKDLNFYLLGFSHFENMTFEGSLVQGLHSRARAYVINIDGFFTDSETGPGGEVMHGGSSARSRYLGKQAWQGVHRTLCGWKPQLCGNAIAFYRQRETGEWIHTGSQNAFPSGVESAAPENPVAIAYAKPRAEKFLASLGVGHDCIVLTYIPAKTSERATASALAATLGYDLVSPQVAGLRTFDGSHLDPPSAELFTSAFLETAGPRLATCLRQTPAAATPEPAK